jgi:hypothetical protein
MTIKSKLKNSVIGLVALVATAMPFTTSQAKANDFPKPYVETTLASDYVSPSGSAVEEAGRQDWASINLKGIELGIFQNTFLKEKSVSERDYCASYSFPISSNLTGKVGFQYWDYPNGRFGNFDSVETVGLNYSGKINASLAYTHLNDNKVTEKGERIHLKLCKPLSLAEGKTKVSLTPSLATAWLDNFYGQNGFSQASAGLNLGVSRGNWNLNLTATAQKALDSDFKSLNWATASIGYQF